MSVLPWYSGLDPVCVCVCMDGMHLCIVKMFDVLPVIVEEKEEKEEERFCLYDCFLHIHQYM